MPNRGKNRKTNPRNDNAHAASSSAAQLEPAVSCAALIDAVQQRKEKRAARAAERRAKSDVLKNTGNTLFQAGDYEGAIKAYVEAIDKYGSTAVLNSNLSAAFLKLDKHYAAEEAATQALLRDPTMLKARYRRGLARKESGQYNAALTDFIAVWRQDSTRTEARDQIKATEELYLIYGDENEDSEMSDSEREDSDDDADWPAYDNEPLISDAESDSSDCHHLGNAIPCRYYNHGGCTRKDTCNYSHTPDDFSERDELGRNVCIYYLLDICKFGEAKCVYSHDKSFLPDGWWNSPATVTLLHGIDRELFEASGRSCITHFIKTQHMKRGSHASQATSQPSSETSYSFILLLALDGDVVEDYKSSTIAAIQAKMPIKKAVSPTEAFALFSSPDLIKAIFVADAALAKRPNATILAKVVQYARGGGSVVIGGSFSSFICPPDFTTFFSQAWGLNWNAGSYHRAAFMLNRSHDLSKTSPSLPGSYSMKALHVQGFDATGALYTETSGSFAESPVVQVPVGNGHLGYIGDVNWEDGSITVLLSLLGLSESPTAPSSTAPSTNAAEASSSSGVDGSQANKAAPTSSSTSSNAPNATEAKAGARPQKEKSGESFVLLLALDGDIMEGYKQPTIELIKTKSSVKIATTQSDALSLLSSSVIGVFVTDAGITNRKNTQILAKLVDYAKDGGSVIIGGAFSTFVRPKDMGTFFLKSWGVPWKPGFYHRTTFSVNPAHELTKANPMLPPSYSMKALHVKDISPDVVIYKPTSASRLESLVFAPGPITNLSESPAVRAPIGKGYISYIGDVNWETGSANLVLAMLGLLNPQTKPQAKAVPSAGPSQPASTAPKKPASMPIVPTLKADAPKISRAPGATSSKKPLLVLLSLEDEDPFATSHTHCLSALRDKVTVSQVFTVSSALPLLDDADLIGVFITDAGIVKPEHKALLPRLNEYVKLGGTIIVGGSFSSFVSASDMNTFFKDVWGLSWTGGAYHRTKFLRNSAHELVSKYPTLVSSYNMKALHLGGLIASDPVYLPADDIHSQTHLPFTDHTESPVVRRKIGEGYFGYVGDVNAEPQTTSCVLALFGLLDSTQAAAKPIKVEGPSKVAEPVVSNGGKTTRNSVPRAAEARPKEPPAVKVPPIPANPANDTVSEFKKLPIGRTRKPFLMVLSFGNEKFFAGVQCDLLDLLRSKLEVLHGLSNERVDELIGSQDLAGIFVTDAAIANTVNAYLLSRLVAFTKAGGTVVLGGSFSSHIRFDDMGPFFQNSWGVPWRGGDYTRCEIIPGRAHPLNNTTLPPAFTVKGLFIAGVTPETAVYVPAKGTHVAAGKIPQSPVALARVGNGRLGYIGDVGLQEEHSKIVLAMFGLS